MTSGVLSNLQVDELGAQPRKFDIICSVDYSTADRGNAIGMVWV